MSDDPEKPNRARTVLEDLKSPPNDAKEAEVEACKLLKLIPSSDIQLTPSGNSAMTNLTAYHCFAVGGYADIYKATMTLGSLTKVVVIKVFREAHLNTKTEEEKRIYKRRLRREYGVWGILDHINILRLEGLAILDELPSPGLVSEYKRHGDLLEFMKKHETFDRLHMAGGVACGLEYLHQQGVVHGDLTPRNILVDLDENAGLFFPLITDFGKSRVLEKDGYTTRVDKTPLVARPPELLECCDDEAATNKNFLTPASDVYSFSLLLLELITGKHPYSQERIAMIRIPALIIDPVRPLRPTPEKYPVLDQSYEFCWHIMRGCWHTEKAKRISSRDAHLWIRTRLPPSDHPVTLN